MAELCLNEISHTQRDVVSIFIYTCGGYNCTTEAERKVPEAGGWEEGGTTSDRSKVGFLSLVSLFPDLLQSIVNLAKS